VKTRTRNAVALVVAASLLCAALVLVARSAPAPKGFSSALQAVPEHASVVLWADLARLRASAFSQLLAEAAASQPEAAPACGARMLDRVQQVSLWVAEGPGQDFGLAALGDLARDDFLRCAEQAIGGRGGLAVTRELEGFTLVEDRALGADAASLAMRQGGPVLLARSRELARMMASAGGRAPSALQDGDHPAMRAAVGLQGDVVLTAVASEAFRGQLRALAAQGEPAWGSVRAAAAVLQAGPTTHLRAMLWCDPPGACETLARLLDALLAEVRGSTAMRFTGIAGVLRDAAVRASQGQLVFELRAPADEVVAVVRRLWRLKESPGQKLPFASLRLPDEVLRPPAVPDGGP
jgi:hypothetical protein